MAQPADWCGCVVYSVHLYSGCCSRSCGAVYMSAALSPHSSVIQASIRHSVSGCSLPFTLHASSQGLSHKSDLSQTYTLALHCVIGLKVSNLCQTVRLSALHCAIGLKVLSLPCTVRLFSGSQVCFALCNCSQGLKSTLHCAIVLKVKSALHCHRVSNMVCSVWLVSRSQVCVAVCGWSQGLRSVLQCVVGLKVSSLCCSVWLVSGSQVCVAMCGWSQGLKSVLQCVVGLRVFSFTSHCVIDSR